MKVTMMAPRVPASAEFGIGVGLVALVGVGFVALWVYNNREKFNPASDKNAAYTGANALLEAATGNKVDTVGTAAGGLVDRVRQWFGGTPDGLAPGERLDAQGNIVPAAGKGAMTPADYQASQMNQFLGVGA